jgi:hypothetical protein
MCTNSVKPIGADFCNTLGKVPTGIECTECEKKLRSGQAEMKPCPNCEALAGESVFGDFNACWGCDGHLLLYYGVDPGQWIACEIFEA